jgi:ATP-dependent Clp protease ATP-binding subunit ClpA
VFERFTDRARTVLTAAQEEARNFNGDSIGTEHLLLGLLCQEDGVGGQALTSLGVTLDAARHELTMITGVAPEPPHHSPPFTTGAKKVLELSLREALQLGHGYIGTEHILLGLTGVDNGVAIQILANLDVGLDSVRQKVLSLMATDADRGRPGPGATMSVGSILTPANVVRARRRATSQEDPNQPEPRLEASTPRCAYCHTDLTTAARFRTLSVPPDSGEEEHDPISTLVVYCSQCGVALHMFQPGG